MCTQQKTCIAKMYETEYSTIFPTYTCNTQPINFYVRLSLVALAKEIFKEEKNERMKWIILLYGPGMR